MFYCFELICIQSPLLFRDGLAPYADIFKQCSGEYIFLETGLCEVRCANRYLNLGVTGCCYVIPSRTGLHRVSFYLKQIGFWIQCCHETIKMFGSYTKLGVK